MQTLVNFLQSLSDANAGKPVDNGQIILCQKQLQQNDIAPIPTEYIELLHHFNAFAYEGSYLYGVSPFKDFFLDILRENRLINHPLAAAIIILGANEYDYLSYNWQDSTYQIIDKSDFMVLNTYHHCNDAVKHILKIEDDNQYL